MCVVTRAVKLNRKDQHAIEVLFEDGNRATIDTTNGLRDLKVTDVHNKTGVVAYFSEKPWAQLNDDEIFVVASFGMGSIVLRDFPGAFRPQEV